jgi:aspartate carbamoyltransferase catalytic subunit
MRGADVMIMLRLQNERMRGALLPSAQEYFKQLRADAGQARAGQARRDRHASRADEPRRRDRLGRWPTARRAVILPQVTFGIAVRMAVLSIVASSQKMQ